MAVEVTPLGFKKPDGKELVRGGDNVIADNAQTAEDRLAYALGQIGEVKANVDKGAGTGHGLVEDTLRPGTYYISDDSPLTPDPANPGFYLIGV